MPDTMSTFFFWYRHTFQILAVRNEQKEKEVSLDALKQVWIDVSLASPTLTLSMKFTGRTSERGCVPNVYLPPQRWQVANILLIISDIKCYTTRRHCRFIAVFLQFGLDTSYHSKVAQSQHRAH